MFSNLIMASSADLYVLLYSESQKCFHIETVSAMVDKNVRMYLDGRSGDYVTIGFGSSVEELREIRSKLVEMRRGVIVPRFSVAPDE
ncbi:hypothetical protein FSI43_019120 [Escherichia coli]|uniref:hypothetical protein n=1 Tax=Escherichia coli TaxID=562 RepID=UPI000D15B3F6|nr:hypothetical protein [Escherichia coli]EFJ8857323.1 hypothetical protein [Escherichia coli]EFJ9345275.1 hypothetical protein [Escherichia coli]EFJ9375218.1 hypothetical protein [Escherichia coli]EFJ9400160.1 hypothetical protein [Escherichia coli]EFK0004916.1 hypothetical protein [Escherichia coli]